MNRCTVLIALALGMGAGVGVTLLLAPVAAPTTHAEAMPQAVTPQAPTQSATGPNDEAACAAARADARDVAARRDRAEARRLTAAVGVAPGQVDVVEGAQVAAGYLAAADRPAEALALTRAMAQDPEMAPLLAEEAARLRGAAEPSLRARGVLLEAGLGLLDARGWSQALRAEPDAAARAVMVAAAPRGDDPLEEERLTAAVLETARLDADPAVRVAAVEALPRLTGEQAGDLVRLLHEDADPRVRVAVANHMSGAEDPAAAGDLLAVARRVAEAPEVRRAAVMALIRIEQRAGGALAAAGVSREQVGELLGELTPDAG